MQIQHEAQRKGENFPVSSWFIPKKTRFAVLTFYDYVRGLDDIADDPTRSSDERLFALTMASDATGPDLPRWAQAYHQAVAHEHIPAHFAQEMLRAFTQDCRQTRYINWDALLDYCRYSAMPVGRFLLWAWQEPAPNHQAADALCALLQILNHLQDIKDDAQQLNRVYLPQDAMQRLNVEEAMLTQNACSPPLQALIVELLDACAPLLAQAKALPPSISSRRLRWQAACTISVAERLCEHLRQQDPLAVRVRLSRFDYLRAVLKGLR